MNNTYQEPYQDQYSLYGQPYSNQVQPQSNLNTDLLMQIFDNSEIIERIEHNLRGERQIQDKDKDGNPLITKKWVKIVGAKQLMNEEGIAKILQVMDNYTNQKIYGYTYFEREEIQNIMVSFAQVIHVHLAKKWVEYEMDKDDIEIIIDMLCNAFWATLQKSFRGFIAENTQSMIYRTEGGRTQIPQQGNERKGVLSKIFPNI